MSTYNAEKFIKGCLEDLEAQTIADRLEIIVVDNGSSDDSIEYLKQFPEIRLIDKKQNLENKKC